MLKGSVDMGMLNIACEQLHLTREEEIEAHNRGDFETLARAQMSIVVKAVRRVAKYASDGEMEDFVSAGYLALTRCLPSFDPTRGVRLSGYVWRAVTSEVYREMKRGAKHKALTFVEYSDSPERPERAMIDSDMRAAINSLPDRLRRLVDSLLDGKTYEEIGSEMGLSRERVRQLRETAIRQLRLAC